MTELINIEEERCAVCLNSLTSSPNISLACHHTFHVACLRLWTQNTCPICRARYEVVVAPVVPTSHPKLLLWRRFFLYFSYFLVNPFCVLQLENDYRNNIILLLFVVDFVYLFSYITYYFIIFVYERVNIKIDVLLIIFAIILSGIVEVIYRNTSSLVLCIFSSFYSIVYVFCLVVGK